MTAEQTRSRALLAAVLVKIFEPRLAKYGVSISTDDVLDLFVGLTAAWHLIAPILERYFPPPARPANPTQPAIPAKE